MKKLCLSSLLLCLLLPGCRAPVQPTLEHCNTWLESVEFARHHVPFSMLPGKHRYHSARGILEAIRTSGCFSRRDVGGFSRGIPPPWGEDYTPRYRLNAEALLRKLGAPDRARENEKKTTYWYRSEGWNPNESHFEVLMFRLSVDEAGYLTSFFVDADPFDIFSQFERQSREANQVVQKGRVRGP